MYVYIKAECLLIGSLSFGFTKYSCIICDSLYTCFITVRQPTGIGNYIDWIDWIGLASGPLYSCSCRRQTGLALHLLINGVS